MREGTVQLDQRFDDNFIANAEEFFLPFEIKKIIHDLLLCIGDAIITNTQ